MINELTLSDNEDFVFGLFEEACMSDMAQPNPQRVSQIVEKALHETIIADTTSFLFKAIPSAITGLYSVASGHPHIPDTDYQI